MRKLPIGYILICGMLISGILACILWCIWAVMTHDASPAVSVGATFVRSIKEVTCRALA